MINSLNKDWRDYCDGLLTALVLSEPTFPDYYQGLLSAPLPLLQAACIPQAKSRAHAKTDPKLKAEHKLKRTPGELVVERPAEQRACDRGPDASREARTRLGDAVRPTAPHQEH